MNDERPATPAVRRTLWSGVLGGIRFIIDLEIMIWVSLYRWIARRPNQPVGATGFAYSAPVTPVLFVFIGLSAVEVPILHLLLTPWPAIQIFALILGTWGLLWMVGYLASMRVNPHLVTDDALVVRSGAHLEIVIPWSEIASISSVSRNLPESKSIQFDEVAGRRVLHLSMLSQTAVDVVLREPLTITLPKGDEEIGELRFFAEKPKDLVAIGREALAGFARMEE